MNGNVIHFLGWLIKQKGWVTGWLEQRLWIRSIDWRVEWPGDYFDNEESYLSDDRWLTHEYQIYPLALFFPHSCSDLGNTLYSNTAPSIHVCLLTWKSHRWHDSVSSVRLQYPKRMQDGILQNWGLTCFGLLSVADRLRSFGQGDENGIVNVLIICSFSLL